MPDLYMSIQAGHFYIAPYEPFISGWPSQERSQLTRSSHFELGLQFLTFRHVSKFISDRQNPEEIQMTRDLYISSLGGHFYIAPYEQFISGWPSPERLAKPRKEPNDQICTCQAKLAILTLRHMSSLSAAGQAQKKRSCKFEARLSDFEEKRSKLLSYPNTRPRQLLRPFPSQKKDSSSGRRRPRGGGSNRYQNPLRFKSPLKRRFRV